MIERVYKFNQSNNKLIEQILNDDKAMINHMILNQGDAMPKHNSNANVYIIIIKGTLTLKLEEQQAELYNHGSIINIPFGIKMDISNTQKDQLEFFVIKAPSPKL